MSVYLQDIPLEEALERLEVALVESGLDSILREKLLPLNEAALGRVLAKPLWARISSPHYHGSAMDGFAVRSAATRGATQTNPILLSCSDNAQYLDTGDPLPDWADAVIPIEEVESLDNDGRVTEEIRNPAAIRIRAAVPPWKHIRPLGEDLVATQLLLPAGHTIRPVDLGVAAAGGLGEVTVSGRPRVAILPTGNELVAIGSEVKPGDIIEYNSLVLAAQVESWGGEATRFPPTPDELQALMEQIEGASWDFDLILLNAGSSAGAEDYSAPAIAAMGKIFVHGVAVRPGHPVIIGMIENRDGRSIPILGVPGYPVSAALTAEIFVEPLLARWLGRPSMFRPAVQAQLTRKVVSPLGDDDYLRVVVGKVGQKTLAAPLARGAGVISSLARADGLVMIPRGVQGYPAGESIQVRLYRSPEEIENTILAVGSHDLTLDLLAQYLAGRGRRLTSANAGSLGGLVALRREDAHLAGSHLLDPETGEYNLKYVREYLPGRSVKVIALVGREQGLIVPPGNPKKIREITDLPQEGIRFINRQRGAGTRVLLDYQLDLKGIDPGLIQGYNREEFTHLSVAAAVASGRADCGLGIAAAAQALGLGFVPLFKERYDLIIPREFSDDHLLVPLWEVLSDPKFTQDIDDLPGYDTRDLGKLIAEIEG